MSQGKQAKTLNDQQMARLLDHASTTRHPARDRVMILLSFKAGLRACEIANLSWSMVTDPDGEVADTIELTDDASKGNAKRRTGGGRTIPMHPLLRSAIVGLKASPPRRFAREAWPQPTDPVCPSERGRFSPNAIAVWFHIRYRRLELSGASSHSGRRTFITNAAKNVTRAGGSLKDVQDLAGHRSLSVTQRYIDADTPAQRRLINMM